VEFSLLVSTGEQVNEVWFYIFDASCIFVSIFIYAVLFPYYLDYGKLVRDKERRPCRRSNTMESQRTDQSSDSASLTNKSDVTTINVLVEQKEDNEFVEVK
jgi:hypothetical protein